jgi:hypothetical protein
MSGKKETEFLPKVETHNLKAPHYQPPKPCVNICGALLDGVRDDKAMLAYSPPVLPDEAKETVSAILEEIVDKIVEEDVEEDVPTCTKRWGALLDGISDKDMVFDYGECVLAY